MSEFDLYESDFDEHKNEKRLYCHIFETTEGIINTEIVQILFFRELTFQLKQNPSKLQNPSIFLWYTQTIIQSHFLLLFETFTFIIKNIKINSKNAMLYTIKIKLHILSLP